MKAFDMSPEAPKNPMSSNKTRLINKGIKKMEDALDQKPDEPQVDEPKVPVEEPPANTPSAEKSSVLRPLIYMTFPTFGYGDEPPVWFESLELALQKRGYLTYTPYRLVAEQLSTDDIEAYGLLTPRLVPSMCSIFNIPPDATKSLELITGYLQLADLGTDNSATVFTNLWFLLRSSIVIADLERPMIGAETAAELVHAKQLGIPVVGMLPGTGTLSPWSQHLTTLLYSDRNLGNILPLIQGYAPLSSK